MPTHSQPSGFRRSWTTLLTLVLLCGLFDCKAPSPQVVVYTSMDRNYAEPVLQRFERETGTDVLAVFDTEATKTTGLANRLLAERANPRADVFWNSEIGRTVLLKREGILEPYRSPQAADIPKQFKDREGFWTGFAGRARVIAYNTELLKTEGPPVSIAGLAAPVWRDRTVMAYPLFGTTSFHFAALWDALGEAHTVDWARRLKANGILIADGNASAMRMVAEGRKAVCMTDTDDVMLMMSKGAPVDFLFPDQDGLGALLIPNTAALIKGGPNPEGGRRFMDYLLSPQVEEWLALSPASVIPLHPKVKRKPGMPALDAVRFMAVDYEKAAGNIPIAAEQWKTIFVR